MADAIAAGHDLIAQVIGAHKVGRLGANDPHAFEFALPQQHLRKAGVVVHRREQPATARRDLRDSPGVATEQHGLRLHQTPRLAVAIEGGQSPHLFRRHKEVGVDHPEAGEDFLPHEIGQASARQAFDYRALHIHADGVAPASSGLIGQWRLCQPGDHVGKPFGLPDACGDIGRVRGIIRVEAITQPRSMGHELTHGGRARRRLAIGPHDPGELRKMPCYRVVR